MLIGGPGPTVTLGALIREFNAAELASLSTGLVTLPAWLAIACSTTGRTTQTSAATLVRGLGANAARARNIGSGTGLAIECARANKLCGNTDTWTGSATLQAWGAASGAVRTNGQAAPDGTSNAVQFALASGFGFGSFCSLKTFAAYGQAGAMSAWARGISRTDGAKPYSFVAVDTDSGTLVYAEVTAATWARYSCAMGSTGQYPTLEYSHQGPATNVLGTTHVYAMQLELGALYPSSYFPIANGAENQTRAADVASIVDGASACPGGFFNLEMVVAPHYAATETAADHDWLFIDSGNRVFFRQSDRKVVARFGGASDIVSGALSFARDSAIRARIEYTATGRRLRVDDATGISYYDSGSVAAGSSIGSIGAIYLGGNASGAQECGDLRLFRARSPS